MMESKLIKRIVLEALILTLISFVVLLVFSFFSSDDSRTRIQENYSEVFAEVLEASYYQELTINNLSDYEGLNSVYEAYDDNGNPVGFITDVMVTTQNDTELHLLTGITYNGAELTGIVRVPDETNPASISDDEIALIVNQAVGCQIPIYVNRNEDDYANSEISASPIPGLHDGVFYAQAHEPDNNGYIDYVEIEVQSGRIVRVQWDAFNIETTSKNRIEASLSGAYSVSGLSWATQSYNLCHALIDCQDPQFLAMKSDGTTAIVDGVTIKIDTFVALAYECINYSVNDFTEEMYFDGLVEIIENITNSDIEYLGVYNRDGFIVFSFEDYEDAFYITDDEDNILGVADVRMIVTEDYNQSSNVYDFSSDTQNPYYNNSSITVDGAEDGLNVGDTISDGVSIDGIPLSEVRTRIDGIPGSFQRSRYVVTAVNVSYRFLKDYLNWMA